MPNISLRLLASWILIRPSEPTESPYFCAPLAVMAPPSGTRKSRQTANSKQSGRAVVPAIPLPHVRRQAAAADAKSPTTSSMTAKTDQTAEPNQPRAESPQSSVSGSAHQVSDPVKPKPAGSDVVSDNSSLGISCHSPFSPTFSPIFLRILTSPMA